MSVEKLTERQKQILELLLTSKTATEIREYLGISASAITEHCKKIYTALGVIDRVELIIEYKYQGLPVVQPKFAKPLTPILSSVFTLTVKGYSVKETAKILDISTSRVQQLRLQLYWSSGSDNLIELLIKSYDVNYNYEGLNNGA